MFTSADIGALTTGDTVFRASHNSPVQLSLEKTDIFTISLSED